MEAEAEQAFLRIFRSHCLRHVKPWLTYGRSTASRRWGGGSLLSAPSALPSPGPASSAPEHSAQPPSRRRRSLTHMGEQLRCGICSRAHSASCAPSTLAASRSTQPPSCPSSTPSATLPLSTWCTRRSVQLVSPRSSLSQGRPWFGCFLSGTPMAMAAAILVGLPSSPDPGSFKYLWASLMPLKIK